MDSDEQALIGILHPRRAKKVVPFQMPVLEIKKRKAKPSKKTKKSKPAKITKRKNPPRMAREERPVSPDPRPLQQNDASTMTEVPIREKLPYADEALEAPLSVPSTAAATPQVSEIIDLTDGYKPPISALRMVVTDFLNMKSHVRMTMLHLKIFVTERYPELDEDLVFRDVRWKNFLRAELFARLSPFIPSNPSDTN